MLKQITDPRNNTGGSAADKDGDKNKGEAPSAQRNPISKRRVHQLQLIYASLEFDENNPEKMLVSQSFFNEHIKRPVAAKKLEKAAAKGPSGSMLNSISNRLGAQKRVESAEEDSEVIRNSVLVCIIKTHLILLKEQWDKWKFFKSSKDDQGKAVNKELKEYKRDVRKKINDKEKEKRSQEAKAANEPNASKLTEEKKK